VIDVAKNMLRALGGLRATKLSVTCCEAHFHRLLSARSAGAIVVLKNA
jgi:hypothetical protein